MLPASRGTSPCRARPARTGASRSPTVFHGKLPPPISRSVPAEAPYGLPWRWPSTSLNLPPSTRLRAGGNTATPSFSSSRPFPTLPSLQALNLAALAPRSEGTAASPSRYTTAFLLALQSVSAKAIGKRAPPASPPSPGDGEAAGQDGPERFLETAPPRPSLRPPPRRARPPSPQGKGQARPRAAAPPPRPAGGPRTATPSFPSRPQAPALPAAPRSPPAAAEAAVGPIVVRIKIRHRHLSLLPVRA